MDHLIEKQRDFFASGQTRPFAFRAQMLRRLREAIGACEEEILAALAADLGKSRVAGYTTEIGPCLAEITHALRNLRQWMKPRRVAGPRLFPLSRGRLVCEPLGVCLVVSPWNYPFHLAIAPLVASIAAGNCTVLKPSELSANTAQALSRMIGRCFDEAFISVVCGGPDVAKELLERKFDHIFYTGGERVGRIVMQAAARHLTPVTLELGGKSPCIVTDDCDPTKAARRIAWGKFLNAGQTCVAPDYLLVQEPMREELTARIKACIQDFYGVEPRESPDYGRIINGHHFDRLMGLLQGQEVLFGGQTDRDTLYISPTLLGAPADEAPVLREEIFGPLLPILPFGHLSEAIDFVNRRPKPLALYVFSRSADRQQQILAGTSSGGVCINDTIVHLTAPTLPFGGVGASGFGRYHGKAGFDAVSNQKSILHQTLLFDVPKRFAPSREEDLRLLRAMLK